MPRASAAASATEQLCGNVLEIFGILAVGNYDCAVVRNSICKRPRDLVGCGAHFIQVILKHVRDDRQPGFDYLMLIYALIIGANSHAFANKGIGTAFDSTVDDLYLF